MTVKSGNTFIIEPEPSRNCELCGAFQECRPYGPNGEQVCISCGLKNLESTIAAFSRLVGVLAEKKVITIPEFSQIVHGCDRELKVKR